MEFHYQRLSAGVILIIIKLIYIEWLPVLHCSCLCSVYRLELTNSAEGTRLKTNVILLLVIAWFMINLLIQYSLFFMDFSSIQVV